MSHDVYISYSNKDKLKADKVVTGLEKRGIKCWIAPRDLKPGMPWGAAIVEAIEASKLVVAILSNTANSSNHVIREIETAINNAIDVIPFRIEDAEVSGALAYFLSTAHWIDGFPSPIEGYLDQLIETLQVYLGLDTFTNQREIKESEKPGRQNEKGISGSIIKRLFGKTAPDKLKNQQSSSENLSIKPSDLNAELTVVDSLEIQNGTSRGVIQLCVGDVTRASTEQAVDVLVTSAFRDDYYPVPGTVFGALYRRGLSVEALASDKEVDLRGAFSCWLSKEIVNPPEGIHFKRLLCYEPSETAKAGEQIGDIFRSLAPFIGGENPIRSVGTTLVAAGSSRRITQQESLQLLLEAAVHWMSSGLPINEFKIICLTNSETKELTHLFADLKSRYASLVPAKQSKLTYDCFISYSHQDIREVDLFVDLLLSRKPDIRIFIDKKELNPGSAWQREIYEAIDDCRKVTTFFSTSYLESKVCLEEFNIALFRHRESSVPILKPIYLYSANLPTYMKLIQFTDCRESDRGKLNQAAENLIESLS